MTSSDYLMKNVRRFYEVSTAHLTQMQADMIESGTFPKQPTMKNEYGWLFSVPESLEEIDSCPREFTNIIAFAQDAGCDYVLFDRDVPLVEYFPSYNW